MKWANKRVLVTGGAGFIGGAIIDRLLQLGASVAAIDRYSASEKEWLWEAKLKRLSGIFEAHGADQALHLIDLSYDRERYKRVARDYDVVFHLAAVFGGREFVDKHQTECSEMLATDHNVISASYEAGVEHLHYASSACVYAPSLNVPGRLLAEDDVLTTGEGWESSDNLYGFAKLMGEMQLLAFRREHGFESSVCRYLTVYGPGEFDASHAIASLIEKAIEKQDPYVVWGSGRQERGFTYVEDIARGSIAAAERIRDATPINLGWDKRYAIDEVSRMILELSSHRPTVVKFDRRMPEGPFSRALDISRASRLLDWAPRVDLEEGLTNTIEWHRALKQPEAATAYRIRVK